MGYRLHVITEYKVKYSIKDALNYSSFDILKLLKLFNVNYEGDIHDSFIEINKEDYENFLYKLKNFNTVLNKEELEHFNYILRNIEETCGEKYEDILKDFQDFYELADKSDDIIRLCYF